MPAYIVFFVIVIGAIIFIILHNIELPGKKYSLSLQLVEIDLDPDSQHCKKAWIPVRLGFATGRLHRSGRA